MTKVGARFYTAAEVR